MTTVTRILAFAALLALLGGCGSKAAEDVQLPMDQIKADLEVVAKSRIFFGHQSVGRNLIAGLQALSGEAGVPLRIEAVNGSLPEGTGLFHADVGQNGAPDSKIEAFGAILQASAQNATPVDAAILKFCYVDLDDDSKEQKGTLLFERYRKAMSDIRAGQPELVLVHATMPLMADPPGLKTRIKRIIGKSTWNDEGNRRRNEYNALVREQLKSEPIADIARLEATLPDGSVSRFKMGDRHIETLALQYTSDGGHLNDVGQKSVAAGFLHALANSLRSRASSPAPVAPAQT
jgi:hypothetical protein